MKLLDRIASLTDAVKKRLLVNDNFEKRSNELNANCNRKLKLANSS